MERNIKIQKTNFHDNKYSDKIKEDKEIELNNSQKSNNQSNQLNSIKNISNINKYNDNFSYAKEEIFNLRNDKIRKYSKESEGLSTSSEDNKMKEKLDNKFIMIKDKDAKKEPYKANNIDFKRKYKTELCKYYEINGYCKFGEKCVYAHGKENLRLKVTNTSSYRTKKCNQFFEKGYCPYGSRCQFAHQLTSNIINNPFDKKMKYTKILEMLSKIEYIENIQNIVKKPRLKVFKEIVENKEDIKSRFFKDIKELASFNENIYF